MTLFFPQFLSVILVLFSSFIFGRGGFVVVCNCFVVFVPKAILIYSSTFLCMGMYVHVRACVFCFVLLNLHGEYFPALRVKSQPPCP